jgi:hypothetical protein
MNKFTLIAHKPDSSDYCRGCCMANYSSDFAVHSNITEEELIPLMVKYRSTILDYNEIGYSFTLITVLNNELVTFEEFYESTHSHSNSGKDYYQDETYMRIIAAIYNGVKEVLAKRALDEHNKKVQKENAIKKAIELEERKEFERLKAKFDEPIKGV